MGDVGVLGPGDDSRTELPGRIPGATHQEAAREALITQRVGECVRRMQERVGARASPPSTPAGSRSRVQPPRSEPPDP